MQPDPVQSWSSSLAFGEPGLSSNSSQSKGEAHVTEITAQRPIVLTSLSFIIVAHLSLVIFSSLLLIIYYSQVQFQHSPYQNLQENGDVQRKTLSTAKSKVAFLGSTNQQRRRSPLATPTSSRSPQERNSSSSPSTKETHAFSESDTEIMDITDDESSHRQHADSQQASLYSYLLTNFDTKFQSPKRLLQQLTKYVHRNAISEIINSRNGIIIKYPDTHVTTTIRNNFSFEIFGTQANLTSLSTRTIKPPRKEPMLSVVVRGVDLTDTEAETELKAGHFTTKCLRIKTQQEIANYMIRVLTLHQQTIDNLLQYGAKICRRHHRIEPSRTPSATSAPL